MKKYLTFESFFDKVVKRDEDYWNSSYKKRWVYMEPIIQKIKQLNPTTAIEIGTAGISLMNFSDSMDIKEKYVGNKHTESYVFDIRETPWNIPNKKYDILVALQVLEHLSPNQSEVFKEIKRISKQAIITLPYLWVCKNPKDRHHNVDDQKIAEWTNHEEPHTKEIWTANNKKRIELYYKF
jgi:hypothetical protein